MKAGIFIVVEGKVAPGRFDEFREIVSRLVSHVEQTEPAALTYSYFQNGSGEEFQIIEQYASVEAVFVHNENIGPYMQELNGMISFRKITAFGEVDVSTLPKSARDILDSLYHEVWTPLAGS